MNIVTKLSQELAADIAEEVKAINSKLESGKLSETEVARELEVKKLLNRQRIDTLGLFLIRGGKYDQV